MSSNRRYWDSQRNEWVDEPPLTVPDYVDVWDPATNQWTRRSYPDYKPLGLDPSWDKVLEEANLPVSREEAAEKAAAEVTREDELNLTCDEVLARWARGE